MGDPLRGLTPTQLTRFLAGKVKFAQQLLPAQGLGPVFNETSCGACHNTPLGGSGATMVTRFGHFDDKTEIFDPLANLRLKLLEQLLHDELRHREKNNLAKYRSFREMLEATLQRYHNRLIDAAAVIRVMLQILVEQKHRLKLGDIVPVGDIFDVISEGTDAVSDVVKRDFADVPDDEMHKITVQNCVGGNPQTCTPGTPGTEICNGVDDDCNGLVDENQMPIACENGGNRYCVAGQYSECPRRCEACIPGSTRTCFTSFCTFWGSQPCTADGRSFGPCKEAQVPAECKSIVDKGMRTVELEQCCIDHGYCCLDEFDLNNNGDRTDMVGQCEAVACTP
jgi:hypothetical protein